MQHSSGLAKHRLERAKEHFQSAKEYAEKLNLLFSYATNGHEIEEFDFLTNKQTTISRFPSPEELKHRYTEAILKGAIAKDKAEKILSEPYHYAPSLSLRYYQEAAAHRAIGCGLRAGICLKDGIVSKIYL